ncbi:hypothetical protein MNEG_12362, partial [Monoraphidium neglectum]
MTAGGVGLAALLHGGSGHGIAAAAAAAAAAGIAAAAAAEAWVAPGRHRNPFVASAREAAAPGTSGICPLGYGVGDDPKHLYK